MHKGIALIELLVYLSIVILLSNLLFAYCVRTNSMIRSCYSQGLCTMRLYAVFDFMKHTLCQAPGKYTYWKVMEPKCLIWQGYDGRSYGFEVYTNKLYKIIGTYDPINKHWLNAHKVVLLEPAPITFEYETIDVGTYKMMYAITVIHDQLRSKIIQANYAYKV